MGEERNGINTKIKVKKFHLVEIDIHPIWKIFEIVCGITSRGFILVVYRVHYTGSSLPSLPLFFVTKRDYIIKIKSKVGVLCS